MLVLVLSGQIINLNKQVKKPWFKTQNLILKCLNHRNKCFEKEKLPQREAVIKWLGKNILLTTE